MGPDGRAEKLRRAPKDPRWMMELARHVGVAASTATEHLNLLVAGGLPAQERQGRHRYVRLADPATAELIENLASMAPLRATPPHSLPAVNRSRALARARTCYDHLAHALGVAITTAMTDRGLLDWEHGLTLTGNSDWITQIGTNRAVVLTDTGQRGLRDHLGPSDDWSVTDPRS
ncbi:helix-turn-helix domain-containing protein [Streptomyces sp. NPDC006670]|uniref:ArsR/SmtB family transcription factor n=1 Tax=Streptomyces sp. NPDC006670 TaxID=3154476 RepID=UPI0033D909B1